MLALSGQQSAALVNIVVELARDRVDAQRGAMLLDAALRWREHGKAWASWARERGGNALIADSIKLSLALKIVLDKRAEVI